VALLLSKFKHDLMAKVLITTVPFGNMNLLPPEQFEAVGIDTYAVVEFRGKPVVGRLNVNSKVSVGEKVKLTFNQSQAVFFDNQKEERIR